MSYMHIKNGVVVLYGYAVFTWYLRDSYELLSTAE